MTEELPQIPEDLLEALEGCVKQLGLYLEGIEDGKDDEAESAYQFGCAALAAYNNRAYIGYTREHQWEAFMSAGKPTRETHGHQYMFTWGPFPSPKIAQWVADHVEGNPHFSDVEAAERVYYQYHPDERLSED